jgi:putative membrane protein insertion efficiency factor
MSDLNPVIARSNATKQSSRFDRLKAPSVSRGWIATPGFAGLAMTFPAQALRALIWLYQRTLSPALVVIAPTCGCRFAPTCSHYARTALQEHGLFAGVTLAVIRLAKCGPWHPGGEDPVPARKISCAAVRPGSSLATPHTSLS